MPSLLSGRKSLLLSILAILVVAGSLVWWYARRQTGGAPRSFQYLPAGSVAAIHLDLAGLRTSSLIRQALKSQAGPQLESDYAEFVQSTGFNFERDLDSVSLGISGPQGARVVHAVLEGRFDRDKVDRYSRERRQATRAHLGHDINLFTGPSGRKFRLAFLAPGRLAFSNAPDSSSSIEKMIELSQRQAPSLESRLRELHVFDYLPPENQVWIAVDMERVGRLNVPAGPISSGTSFSADFLRGSRMGLVAARIGDRDVELRMVAACVTGEEARRVAQALSGLRALLAALAAREDPKGAAGSELARALERISIGVEKNAAVVRWKLETALLERMLREPGSPRAGASLPTCEP